MQIQLDLASAVPVYRQVVEQMRVLLVDGRLREGQALPSVRRLAIDLGVHFNTIAEAYRQLAAEGWLGLRHGRRAIVLGRREVAKTSPGAVERFREELRSMVARARSQGVAPGRIARELRRTAEVLEQ